VRPGEVIRSTPEEKAAQIATVAAVQERNAEGGPAALERLQRVALAGGNVFEELMETTKVCTLGQITGALFAVGGQYRRNM
jgi:methylmalonyl-CoA mutase